MFSIANNLNASRSQSFAYDQLNGIVSAGTSATSGSFCWGYQYGYDAWGNLLYQQGWTPNYNGCSQTIMGSVTADANNHISAFSYDASGNATSDGAFAYTWDAESQMKTAAGVTYTYDGDGRRVAKSNGKLYWYGSGGEILAETDASGNTTAEYVFFGGKRVALIPAGASPNYYVEDLLGTSRVITTNTGAVCYDADFYPFGGERSYTNTCPQNYKFEGKERDTETGNDDFGARYYSNRFGRWLSADWSSVPSPVPYANLANPQTLNLYAMVADDPESFADLDGHECPPCIEELVELALKHPETTEKIIDVTVKVVTTVAEAEEEAVVVAAKGSKASFLGVLSLALLMEGDNAPPKKKDDSNQNDKNKPGNANPAPQPDPNAEPTPQDAEHKKNPRESTRDDHERGKARKKRDSGEEKGDKARKDKGMFPRKRPPGHKGPWPPKKKLTQNDTSQ